jgi:hypothetical protein
MKSHTSLIGLIVVLCAALLGCDIPTLNNNLREPEINANSPTSGMPGEARGLSAVPGAGTVQLTWTDPTDADFHHAEISYNADNGPIQVWPKTVLKGVQQITIGSLTSGAIYTFWVRLVDTGGNKSVGSVVIVSLASVVNDLALDAYVTAPVQNSAPDRQRITAVQYTGTVEWVKGSNIMTDSSFVQGLNYTAQVTLKANPGYTFSGLTKEDWTYSGATVGAGNIQDAGKGFFMRIVFPPAILGWYVTVGTNDSGRDGKTLDTSVYTVAKALEKIEAAYAVTEPPASVWPGKADNNPQSAAIVIVGTFNGSITINNTDNKYPPIVLRGLSATSSAGTITATSASRVLTVATGAQVTLESNLTLTGGHVTGQGGGVHVSSTDAAKPAVFTMKGGIITGNTATVTGGGVFVGSNSSFSMSGGSITGNTANRGGGVDVLHAIATNRPTFTMSGGTIAENKGITAASGVYLNNAIFTMTGGSISYNSGADNNAMVGGIMVNSASTFTMDGGTISYNVSAGLGGAGGVFVLSTSEMIMNGGSIHHNKAGSVGGGVLVDGDTPSFTMNGGTISDNEASEGGGAGVGNSAGSVNPSDRPTFTMKGGSITGNTATEHGGGVYVATYGVFTKGHADPAASSGIIYGYDPDNPNSNKVESGNSIVDDKGHAVYVEAGPKMRETTVTPDQHLDSATADGWAE